ncbi:hypothetical protein AB6O49_31320 [Streptomyces sp. SBR177]
MAPLIALREVSKSFTARSGTVTALDSIDLDIEAGRSSRSSGTPEPGRAPWSGSSTDSNTPRPARSRSTEW